MIEKLLTIFVVSQIIFLIWVIFRDSYQFFIANKNFKNDIDRLNMVMGNWKKSFEEQQKIIALCKNLRSRVEELENEKKES